MIKQLIHESTRPGAEFSEAEQKMIWKFRQLLVKSLIAERGATDDSGCITKQTRYDADGVCRTAVYNDLPKCIKLRYKKNDFDPNIDLLDRGPTFKSGDFALLMFMGVGDRE